MELEVTLAFMGLITGLIGYDIKETRRNRICLERIRTALKMKFPDLREVLDNA